MEGVADVAPVAGAEEALGDDADGIAAGAAFELPEELLEEPDDPLEEPEDPLEEADEPLDEPHCGPVGWPIF